MKDKSLNGIRSKRVRDLVRKARALGCSIEWGGNGHVLIHPPDGGKPTWVSATMEDKDPRAYLNARASLRRAGVDV